MRVVRVVAALLLLAGCSSGLQQTAIALISSRTQMPATPSAAASIAPINGFDASVSSLPRRFEGDDVMRVRAALVRLNPQKGEFETTAEHEERLARLRDVELAPGRRFDSIYAFSAPYSPRGGDYDADRGVFPITRSIGPYSRQSFREAFSGRALLEGLIPIRMRDRQETPVRGRSALGATSATVRADEVGLAVVACGRPTDDGRRFERFECPNNIASNEIRVPRDHASEVQHRMRLLVVGPLRNPFVGETVGFSAPHTSRNSFDRQTTYETVVMRAREVIVYDYETGDILYRMRL